VDLAELHQIVAGIVSRDIERLLHRTICSLCDMAAEPTVRRLVPNTLQNEACGFLSSSRRPSMISLVGGYWQRLCCSITQVCDDGCISISPDG